MIYEWSEAKEEKSVNALIDLFNTLFASQNVILMHSDSEPEYFAATYDKPARIAFAHGFFASALHEISHWCIAGQARRLLDDFGYWYAADGRNQDEQLAFERVEIKPQALECLFSLACHRPFRVSQDNIFATFDTSSSTFAADVYKQA
ncbi:elongation factor P hydroxylase, partial [Psychrobacter sp. T6-1]